ncbi:Os03g0799801, partial [Oryza sativa Japonica Group]
IRLRFRLTRTATLFIAIDRLIEEFEGGITGRSIDLDRRRPWRRRLFALWRAGVGSAPGALTQLQPKPAATVISPRLLSHGGLLRREALPPPLSPYRFFSSGGFESPRTVCLLLVDISPN